MLHVRPSPQKFFHFRDCCSATWQMSPVTQPTVSQTSKSHKMQTEYCEILRHNAECVQVWGLRTTGCWEHISTASAASPQSIRSWSETMTTLHCTHLNCTDYTADTIQQIQHVSAMTSFTNLSLIPSRIESHMYCKCIYLSNSWLFYLKTCTVYPPML